MKNGQALFTQRWFPGCHYDLGPRWRRKPAIEQICVDLDANQALGCGLFLEADFLKSSIRSASKKPREYFTTKIGIVCDRSKMLGAQLVERAISLDQLRKDISAHPRRGFEDTLGARSMSGASTERPLTTRRKPLERSIDGQ
jgi:hypothetical protein